MRGIQHVQNHPRGMITKQMGSMLNIPASAVAMPLSLTTSWLLVKARSTNTETVWMALTTTAATSTLGFAISSLTQVELPIDASSLTLYFSSAGASSGVDYIALGNPNLGVP